MKHNQRFLMAWLLAAVCTVLLLPACDLFDTEVDIPAYLYIPEVRVETDFASEGTASAKLTEVWVTVNGSFLGAYPIPATIPILASGDTEIAVQAGIKDNGISSMPEIYPFFAADERIINLSANETDTLRPVFRYLSNANFAFIENFEGARQVFEDVRLGEATQLSISSEDAFEGSSALRIRLTTDSPIVEAATLQRYQGLVSPFISTVYLEMDYKSDVPVIFGIVSYNSGGLPGQGTITLDPGFNPSGVWNKIYFNLSLLVIESGLDEHQIVFQTAIPIRNGEFTRDEAEVWIDNLKLIHF